MSMAAVAIVDPPSNLRAELAEGIKAAWHKGRQYYIKLGRLLIEARQQLSAGEFNVMLQEDLPFGYDNARRFMRIAADPRVATLQKAPDSFAALDELRRLNDEQFESAIATGQIHDDLTVKEAQQIVRDYIIIKPHRPLSSANHVAPRLPRAVEPQTWAEMVGLHIDARHAVALTQEALDDKMGCCAGQISKYEIPHQDDGRVPEPPGRFEWLQGLQPRHSLGDFVAVHTPLLRGLVGYAWRLEGEVAMLRAKVAKGTT